MARNVKITLLQRYKYFNRFIGMTMIQSDLDVINTIYLFKCVSRTFSKESYNTTEFTPNDRTQHGKI
jgi:hypothetical protein